jgi:methionine biosynthesis protein MetW
VGVSKYDIELNAQDGRNSSHWQVADLVGSAKRVLDVGCSTGYFAEALAARGNEVLGVEYDEASARAARERGLDVLAADLERVDLAEHFGESSFDVVVFADVLEHLRDPLPVLRSARRLLRPGGFVVISLPNIAHGDVRLALLDGRFDYTETGILDDTHTRFFTRRSLVEFVRSGGFVVAELRRTTADLFQTELGLDAGAYDDALVERVRADPEATTYQFVLKAIRDDASASGIEHAERLHEVTTDRDRLVSESARLHERVARLEGEARHWREAASLAEQAAFQSDALQGELRELAAEQQRRAETEITRLRADRRRARLERDRLRDQLRGSAPEDAEG